MTGDCPVCEGEGAYLGSLGGIGHYRCRACGWTFSEVAESALHPDDVEEDRTK